MRALEAGDEDGLVSALARWKRLLNDEDAAVRLQAEKFVHTMLYGLPRAPVDVEIDLLGSPEWKVIEGRFVELVRVRPDLQQVMLWLASGEGPRPLPVLDVRLQ